MHFKLIIALVEDKKTNDVLDAAREEGATGATVVSQARGEGVKKSTTFFGLTLETQRDMVISGRGTSEPENHGENRRCCRI